MIAGFSHFFLLYLYQEKFLVKNCFRTRYYFFDPNLSHKIWCELYEYFENTLSKNLNDIVKVQENHLLFYIEECKFASERKKMNKILLKKVPLKIENFKIFLKNPIGIKAY